jgi:hypothetical protein
MIIEKSLKIGVSLSDKDDYDLIQTSSILYNNRLLTKMKQMLSKTPKSLKVIFKAS